MLDQENRFVKVRWDGKVIYNRRLTLTLACNMNLLRYILLERLLHYGMVTYSTMVRYH